MRNRGDHRGSPVSYGRAHELEVVQGLLDDVLEGRPRTLVVEGEAGIGKTWLATEAAELASKCGFTTVLGAAQPSERSRPFAAIGDVLDLTSDSPDPSRAEIAATLATVEDPKRATWADPVINIGFRVADATIDLLQQLAQREPLLIVMDDLHWADQPSTLVIGSAQPRLAGLPIALVTTVRGSEAPSYVNELLDRLAASSTFLTLGRLGDDAIAALCEALGGGVPGETLRSQLARVGGNPFFATELMRTLGDLGELELSGGVVDTRSSSVPQGLVETVLRRLRLLPEETYDLLQVAAVLGQSFSARELAVVSERPALDVLRLLKPALQSGAIRGVGDQLAFGHALTWEATYHDMPVSVRRAVHRGAATALSVAGVPPVRVARHFVLGADVGDAEAVGWLRRAARTSAPSSPAAAAELLGNALELTGEDRAAYDSIAAELAPLLVVTGRVDEATTLAEGVLARRPDPAIEAKLRVGMTHVMMRCGRVDEACAQITLLLDRLPPTARPRAQGVASYVHVTSGDVLGADTMAHEALAASEGPKHDVVEATALMTLTWTQSALGRIEQAIETGRRAVAVTEASQGPFSGFLFPHCPLGGALLRADRIDDAERAFTDGLHRAERTAAPGAVVYHHAGLAAAKFFRDEWGDAVSEAEVAIGLTERTGTSWPLLPAAVLARIAIAQDDLPTAHAAIETALASPAFRQQMMTSDWLHWARAILLAASGDIDAAADSAEKAWWITPELRDAIANRHLPIDCVRVLLAAGKHDLATEVAHGVEALARGTSARSLAAAAAHCRGLVDGDPEAVGRAAELLRDSPRRYQLAMAYEDAADLLPDARRDEARTAFRRALDIYRELDAERDSRRVAATMRAAGWRPGNASRRTGEGLASLTRTENAVAELVAEGLSNPKIGQRLFISRHTAETHVKHIFTKVGVSSRAELAALVVRSSPAQVRVPTQPHRNT